MTLRGKPLASALLGLLAAPAVSQPVSTAKSFFEPFDKVDERRWYVSDGWSNGNHQGCTWRRNHLGIGKGILYLRLDDKGDAKRPYGCAELRTREKLGYGLYEVRMRAAAGSGLNTAMFTWIGPPFYNRHDEVDFEFLGKSPNGVQLNYYSAGKGGHESIAATPGAAAGFHTYAFDWSADAIRWYVDGKLVRTAMGDDLPHTPGSLFLSLWNGSPQVNGWLGAFRYNGQPVLAAVDWIAFTRAGERCAFPQSLRCQQR
jgi:endo-1,3-1,4-beta-glycanase ExoK